MILVLLHDMILHQNDHESNAFFDGNYSGLLTTCGGFALILLFAARFAAQTLLRTIK